MRILRWIIGIFAAIVVVLGVAFLVAVIAVPAERTFVNEVEINAPAERVWAVIMDKDRYTEWQTSITKVEKIDEKNWIEHPKDAPEPIRFTLSKDARPESTEFHYTMGDFFEGHWKGDMTPTANGVKLRTTDSYKVNGAVSKVFMSMFFDLDTFAKEWNSKLKARVESLK
ncbi:MAG TPA: SRPBCC family protein [Pyrinomonadaceae bacterium]